MIDAQTFASIQHKTSKSTPIFIADGAVTGGEFVARLLQEQPHSRHILLSDNKVYKLHGKRLESYLRAAGVALTVCLVPPGEASKSRRIYLQLIDEILGKGIDKNSYILTLGGGVINNLGGFLAATLYRGIGLIHLPSTMMAQLDAAIDLRQAINHPLGKNLIGCFYSPDAIVVDPKLLESLPLRHLRNGIAEAIKHSLTQSRPFYNVLLENAGQICDPAFLEQVVKKTIRLKLSLIKNENRSNRSEFLLQYGHGIGHALETVTGYALLHGEAISIGMTISAGISRSMNIGDVELVDAHRSILHKYKLPVSIPAGVDIDSVLEVISHDKNVSRNTFRLAVLQSVGKPYSLGDEYFVCAARSELRNALRNFVSKNKRSAR